MMLNRLEAVAWLLYLTAGLLSLQAGCAHYPVNAKLEKYEPPRMTMGAMLKSPNRADDLVFVVSFSGGGTRAAALSYGVLEALAEIEIPAPPNSPHAANHTRHHLAHEVDLVTGVSGGSIAAAYFALHGDGAFKDFKESFLYRNVTWGLIGRLLNPFNMIRVASAYFNKSDLEAEYLDDHLFHGATFKDINPHVGPGLLIQATDISDGHFFPFVPLQFGLICSDLAAYPLARATAASSSVPGALGAITLKNYTGQCGFLEEGWMTDALTKADFSSRAYRVATQLQSYRNWNDKPFIHLVDGVVSDNLGLRSYLEFFTVYDDIVTALKTRGLENVRRVAFIIVNAETKHSTKHWSLLEEDPGLTDVGDVALTAMINNYTFESMALLRSMVKEWAERSPSATSGSKPLDYYVTEITFKALPDIEERQGFLDMPTSFDLPEADVDRLREAGKRILYGSPDFRRLVRDLGGKLPGSTVQPSSPSAP
jgi:NTE family protein